MSAAVRHVLDELQLRVDGRLDPAALARVDAHLESCESCRRAAADLARMRELLRSLPSSPMPTELSDTIARALDAESASPSRQRLRRRQLVAAGLAAAALVTIAVWLAQAPSLPSAAAGDIARVTSAELDLDLRTDEPAALERHFEAHGLPVRVLDLAMMGWQLEGGRVHALRGQPSALYVYRRADGRRLVCQMFAGTMADLPRPAETRESGGITFAVFHEGDRTVVFWQEGAILCVLGSDLPREEVVALAIAKAMKPA